MIAYRPDWGRAFGVNAALVLGRMDYWLARATKTHAGHRWVFKSYVNLAAELGMSSRQVRTALDRLRALGLVVAIRNPHVAYDRTWWWRIDRDRLTVASAPYQEPLGDSDVPRENKTLKGIW